MKLTLTHVGKVKGQTPQCGEHFYSPPVGRQHMRLKYENLLIFGRNNPNNQQDAKLHERHISRKYKKTQVY